jgi:hypothetical protein
MSNFLQIQAFWTLMDTELTHRITRSFGDQGLIYCNQPLIIF